MGTQFSQDTFLKRVKESHGDRYDYSKSVYSKSNKKVIITCKVHGDFEQIPNDHWSGIGCPKCHTDKGKTWTEQDEDFLKKHYIEKGARFCAQGTGKTQSAVWSRAQMMGLRRMSEYLEPHDKVPAMIWRNLLNHAEEKSREVSIDRDYIWCVFEKQDFKCALTGWTISFEPKGCASVDRIDSKLGYTQDNIQIVHSKVNRAKVNYDERFFYKMCKAITEYRAHDLDVIENFSPPL